MSIDGYHLNDRVNINISNNEQTIVEEIHEEENSKAKELKQVVSYLRYYSESALSYNPHDKNLAKVLADLNKKYKAMTGKDYDIKEHGKGLVLNLSA